MGESTLFQSKKAGVEGKTWVVAGGEKVQPSRPQCTYDIGYEKGKPAEPEIVYVIARQEALHKQLGVNPTPATTAVLNLYALEQTEQSALTALGIPPRSENGKFITDEDKVLAKLEAGAQAEAELAKLQIQLNEYKVAFEGATTYGAKANAEIDELKGNNWALKFALEAAEAKLQKPKAKAQAQK